MVTQVLIWCFWGENYGKGSDEEAVCDGGAGGEGKSGLSTVFREIRNEFLFALGKIRANTSILLLGLSQSLFEGAVYTFVFCWVLALQVGWREIFPVLRFT